MIGLSNVRKPILALLGLAALALATVVVFNGSSASAAGQTLRLSASAKKPAFNKTRLVAHAGRVTLVMANPATFPHAIAVEGRHVDKRGKVVRRGGVSRVTVTLKRGTYSFYCPVPGHKAAGMEGKLIVR